jgi:hypothetical protein
MTPVVHLVLDSRCCRPCTTRVVFQLFMAIIDYVKHLSLEYNFIITCRTKHLWHFLPNLLYSAKSFSFSAGSEWNLVFRKKFKGDILECCSITACQQQVAVTVTVVVDTKENTFAVRLQHLHEGTDSSHS